MDSRRLREFKEIREGINACTICSAFAKFGYWKFPDDVHGNPASPIWIVGADPRRIDVALQHGESPAYWMGASRRNLRDPLENHYSRRLEDFVYLTDAVKCQRPARNIPPEATVTCPPTWLTRELEVLRPRAILAVGTDALAALARCSDEADGCEAEIVDMPHPSPANGRAIRERFGIEGWSGYHEQLLGTFEGWQHLFLRTG